MTTPDTKQEMRIRRNGLRLNQSICWYVVRGKLLNKNENNMKILYETN
jgi:hypothetical protein